VTPPDTTSPVLDLLAVRPSAFAPNSSGPLSITAARGASVAYSLDEAATVTFRVQRRAAGRRVGRRCAKPTRSNRKRRRCTRWVATRGSFSHASALGVNRFHFTGWVGSRKLRRGRYRLVAVAADTAGNRARPVRAQFRIIRRR